MRAVVGYLPRRLAEGLAQVVVGLPRVSYWVMVHSGLGEHSVGFPTALAWARHVAALDVDSVRGFLLAAEQQRLRDGELAELSVPVLVLDGGKDLFAPRSHAARLLATLPDARGIHMSLASHMGLAGHAPIVLALIRGFLSEQGL